jgi:hypothetical protein
MSTLRVRPPWYSLPSLFVLCIVVLVVAVAPVTNWGLLWTAGIVAVLLVIGLSTAVIDVTDADVRFRGPFARRSVPRDQVGSMHLFGTYVSFANPQNLEVLKLGTLGWTRRQWLDISEVLGVPLYNHRTQMGLGRDAQQGRLMQRPGPGIK